MLVIRLARGGRSKYPTYRIVAAEKSRAATGKFVSVLGTYNPHTKAVTLKKEEVSRYLGNGAQPSNRVIKLLQDEKIEMPEWVTLKTRSSKPKKEPAEPKAEAPVEAASDDSESAAPAEAEPTETSEALAAEGEVVASVAAEQVAEVATDQPVDAMETAADADAVEANAVEAQDAAAKAAESDPEAKNSESQTSE